MNKTYPIIYVPNAVLKTVSSPVESLTSDIQKQMDMMLETMHVEKGIGLAANQVNITNRVLVMDVPEGCWEYQGEDSDGILQIGSAHRGDKDAPTAQPLLMANPEIVKQSEQRSVYLEGCLSLPNQFADVERPAHVTIKYIDRDGKERTKDFSGLDSHCVQHEIDHLNGILFVDYLSKLKRDTLLRKLDKYKRAHSLL
jgi:peptide deformylase